MSAPTDRPEFDESEVDPREGEERTVWGWQPRSWTDKTQAYFATEAQARGFAAKRSDVVAVRRTVRTIPDGNGGTWVHTSSWQEVQS